MTIGASLAHVLVRQPAISRVHHMNGSPNHCFNVFKTVMFCAIFGGHPLEMWDELKTDGRATRGCLVPVDLTTF